MSGIPVGITRQDVLKALRDLDAGAKPKHRRASTRYDLVHEGRRYAPKAVISMAARRLNRNKTLVAPFSGGEESKWSSKEDGLYNSIAPERKADDFCAMVWGLQPESVPKVPWSLQCQSPSRQRPAI